MVTAPVIYDPRNPPPMFDGHVQVFSTCRACGDLMHVTNPDEHTHPTCQPQPTYLESLAQGWLSTILANDVEAQRYTGQELREAQRKPPDLAGAAVLYTKWSWPVFPLAERSHRPAIRSAHPEGDPLKGKCKGTCGKAGHGFHDATTDTARITRWWAKHPQHNIGLATGTMFDVIDIDPKNNGVPSFMQLLEAERLPDVHGVAVTRSGGLHLYVAPKGGRCHPGIRQGIDYKSNGGFVVAPPSTMGFGRSYSWLVEPSPKIKGVHRD